MQLEVKTEFICLLPKIKKAHYKKNWLMNFPDLVAMINTLPIIKIRSENVKDITTNLYKEEETRFNEIKGKLKDNKEYFD